MPQVRSVDSPRAGRRCLDRGDNGTRWPRSVQRRPTYERRQRSEPPTTPPRGTRTRNGHFLVARARPFPIAAIGFPSPQVPRSSRTQPHDARLRPPERATADPAHAAYTKTAMCGGKRNRPQEHRKMRWLRDPWRQTLARKHPLARQAPIKEGWPGCGILYTENLARQPRRSGFAANLRQPRPLECAGRAAPYILARARPPYGGFRVKARWGTSRGARARPRAGRRAARSERRRGGPRRRAPARA